MSNYKVTWVQTARDTADRMRVMDPVVFEADLNGQENELIHLYPDVRYQEIEGFGGAFTEAAAVTLAKLSEVQQQRILEAYFHPTKGIGYSLCRTHIHSCDFSLGNYTYVEDGDVELSTFSVERDTSHLIPMIQGAMNVEGAAFRLLASPWSPPGWMKDTGQMNEGGHLLPAYRDAWALYYAKYIQAYGEVGIPIWAISVQNEAKAVQRWDSCVYTAEEERDFVRDHLGPTLHREGLEDVHILVWDHNKERVYERARVAFMDEEAAKYIWGMAFHWYSGDHFGALDAVHQQFPNKKLLFTEGCVENGVQLGAWHTGERYGHHLIGDLNHYCSGWIDWNMLLDERGGPNHVANYCDAPVIADTNDGDVTFESSFYYLGHFSKYVRPGATRIGHSTYTDKLESVAFENVDGTLVVIVMNRTDESLPYSIRLNGSLAANVSLPHSIQTAVITAN